MEYRYDLSQLNLSTGAHYICVAARAANYKNSNLSNIIQYTLNGGSHIEQTNDYGITVIINEYTEQPNLYGTTVII